MRVKYGHVKARRVERGVGGGEKGDGSATICNNISRGITAGREDGEKSGGKAVSGNFSRGTICGGEGRN